MKQEKERIYVSIKTGRIHSEVQLGNMMVINPEPVTMDLKKFKLIGTNHVYKVYERR